MNNDFYDKWFRIHIKTKRKKFLKLESLLSEWYGSKNAKNEITAYLPKPVSVSETVHKLMSEAKVPEQAKLIHLQKEWVSLVGEQVGKVSRPASIKNGYLTIEVNNSIFLMELKNYHRPLLEKKIRSLCGRSFFKKLLFVPTGKS